MNILEMMKTDKSFAYKHSDEFLDVIELSYDEAINMVETGKILDAKTVSLLYKCEKYFKMEN